MMSLLNELNDAIIYFSHASTAADHSHAVAYGKAVLNHLPPLTSLTPQERELALHLAYSVGDYNLIKSLRLQENK